MSGWRIRAEARSGECGHLAGLPDKEACLVFVSGKGRVPVDGVDLGVAREHVVEATRERLAKVVVGAPGAEGSLRGHHQAAAVGVRRRAAGCACCGSQRSTC